MLEEFGTGTFSPRALYVSRMASPAYKVLQIVESLDSPSFEEVYSIMRTSLRSPITKFGSGGANQSIFGFRSWEGYVKFGVEEALKRGYIVQSGEGSSTYSLTELGESLLDRRIQY